MPVVPSYQRSNITTQAGPAPQANPNAPIEAFGGGQALAGIDAAGKALGQLSQVIQEQKKQADDVMTMDAYQKAVQTKNDLLFNPESGAMTQKGMNAVSSAKQYREQFDKRMGDIEGSLQNDDQRRLFQRVRARVGEDFGTTVERHVYDQSQKYQAEVEQSTAKAALDDATLNYWQPGKVQESVTLIKGLAKKNAEAQGLGDLAPQKEKEAASRVYASVLDRMMAVQDPAARGFYLGVQGEMTAEDRERIDKTMKVATTKLEADQNVNDINSKHRDLGGALRAARELPSGEVRDETIRRLKDYHADLKLADDERDRVRFDNAADIIQRSQGQSELTPQMLSGLKPSQIRELNEFRKQLRTGISAEVNSDAYLNALKMSAQDPTGFRNLKLGEMRSQIAPGQLSELAKMQVAMRNGQHSPEQAEVRATQRFVTQNLNAMGLSRTRDGEQVKLYEDEVYRRTREMAEELKRSLTDDERQSIADTLAMRVNDGWVFGGQRLYQLDPTEEAPNVSVVNIPRRERREIEAALRQHGRPATDENILELFNRGLVEFRGR